MLSLVLIKTHNAPIPNMKIGQIQLNSGKLDATLIRKHKLVIRPNKNLDLSLIFLYFINRRLCGENNFTHLPGYNILCFERGEFSSEPRYLT